MGRLPTHYADKKIIDRLPYVMFTDVVLGSDGGVSNPLPFAEQQFPDRDMAFDADKPFEIHRIIPWAQFLRVAGSYGPVFPAMSLLDTAEVFIRDGAKSVDLTKGFARMSMLVRGESRQTWEFEDPYYLTRGENLHASIRAVPASIDPTGQAATRYMLAFVGALVTVEG